MQKIFEKKESYTVVFLVLELVGNNIFFSWQSPIGHPTEPLKSLLKYVI